MHEKFNVTRVRDPNGEGIPTGTYLGHGSFDGGCQAPMVAHARFGEDRARLRVDGLVDSIDGEEFLRAGTDARLTSDDPSVRLGAAIAACREVTSSLLAYAREAALHGAGLLAS